VNPLFADSASPLELTLPSGRLVLIPLCFRCFKLWQGTPIRDSFGHKPVLDWNGEPLFAELAILRLIQASGWEGVWIDTYRRRFLQYWPHTCALPNEAQIFLDKANQGRKWPAGCFDVFAFKDDHLLFIEAKWRGHDSIKAKMKIWLELALNSGLSLESFLIFEWSIDAAQSAFQPTRP
jgi:hypothetical protein